jgi:hypothetical protein
VSDFASLREVVDDLAGRSLPPDFGELRHRAVRRGRRRVALVVTTSLVALGAASGVLATGTLRGSEEPAPVGEPTTPSPTTVEESIAPAPTTLGSLADRLDVLLAQAPGWSVTNTLPADYDYAFNGPCSGDWRTDSMSGGDGGIGGAAGIGGAGFASKARASAAVNRFVDQLESCAVTDWQTRPIAQTGAVLAVSPNGVAWIQQLGRDVRVLQVPTTDGPPPEEIQAQVAEWIVGYQAWQDAQHD